MSVPFVNLSIVHMREEYDKRRCELLRDKTDAPALNFPFSLHVLCRPDYYGCD